MRACWDGEDIIQLLKGALFGLWNPEEDHDKSNNIGPSVEAEYALFERVSMDMSSYGGCRTYCSAHGSQHERQEHREHGSPEQTCCDGPAHPNFTVGEWEDFCRVRKWDGTFAWGVEHSKDVDEHGHQG